MKTVSEIISSIKKRLAYSNPTLDLTSGNVVTDLGVESFAEELAAAYTEEDRIRLLYLFDDTAFTEEEADALASSFGIYRRDAVAAVGEVIFCASERPSQGAVFSIPAGTSVSTSEEDGNSITYITTTDGYIDESTAINPNTGYYECSVSVQATVVGTRGNVGPGTINTITGKLSGISAVYNTDSLVSGVDVETRAELIRRVKTKLAGSTYGTKNAYLSKMLEYPSVRDAVIVDPNSPFSVRGPGTIDIYILGGYNATYNQLVYSHDQKILLTKNPVVNNGQAYVVFSDGTTITQGQGFQIQDDIATAYAKSSRAKDYLVWDESMLPSVVAQQSYTITYVYNKLIEDMQEEIDDEDTRIITTDVLARTTRELKATMDFDIVTLPGYDNASVRNAVIFTIQNFVNNFGLEQALRQSDIIGIVEDVPGVDYIKLPMRRFCVLGKDEVVDVEAAPLEYIRIDASDLLVG